MRTRILLPAICLAFLACSPERASGPRSFAILSINDVYRIEGIRDGDGNGQRGGLARLRTLRRELEKEHPGLLLLHAGDFLSPSLMGLTYSGRQMVDVMNRLDGDAAGYDLRMAVTFGNHEFDLRDPRTLRRRLRESQFRWLGSNIHFEERNGAPAVDGDNLVSTLMLEANGVRVGLFSLTLDMGGVGYASFDDPIETARRLSGQLRGQGAEVVVALTHQRLSKDIEVVEQLGDEGPDLILGGHEHTRQNKVVQGRRILKADADAVSAVFVTVRIDQDGVHALEPTFYELGPQEPEPDADIADVVDYWKSTHAQAFCSVQSPPAAPSCLEEQLGTAAVKLVAEETQIRRFETNFGNWVADMARQAYPQAQAAFIGSGGLRINQDIPAGPITREDLAGLLPFPTSLRLLKISGRRLQEVMDHAVQDWTGNGWWLQVSGLAFRHDPENERAADLTLLTGRTPRLVRPDDQIYVIANDYIAGGRDGYTMLGPRYEVPGAPRLNLYQLLKENLADAGAEGIGPAVQGRICNDERPGPCLALH